VHKVIGLHLTNLVCLTSTTVLPCGPEVQTPFSFDPSPDYPGIAAAAGKAWGATVTTQSELDPAIKEDLE
jgi:hypothetical protein